MTLLAEESSAETSEPREAIEMIVSGIQAYRVATGTRDIVIGAQTYTAYPSNREEVKIGTSGNGSDLVIRLPLAHAVPQRYLAIGVPPRRIAVVVYRKQAGGDYESIWRGDVTSLGVNGQVALLRVPARVSEVLQRRCSTLSVGRLCPHVLYDSNCKVARAGFTVSTTVADVNGRVVKVASIGGHPDQWSQFGELLHTSSGERMTIQDQTGTTITMQLGIYELEVGDAVQVFAGCDHGIATCRVTFANRVNFGGQPQLNTERVDAPEGFGIKVT